MAGIAHSPTRGCNSTSSGAQASWATNGSATAVDSQRGKRRESHTRTGRSHNRIPAVAATDSPKPTSCACQGSSNSSRITVVCSAGSATERRPKATATSSTPPMVAARTTEPPGRTNTTIPNSTKAASPARQRRGTAPRLLSTSPSTIATCCPDTAVK